MRRRLFPLQKHVVRLGTRTSLLFLTFLFCFPAWTQLGAPAPVPATAQPEVPKDSLGRTTPRGTVLGFLTAAREGKDDVAAQYLNTRLRGKAAAGLAHQLFTVLDRRLPPMLTQLSDKPEGWQGSGPQDDRAHNSVNDGPRGDLRRWDRYPHAGGFHL